MLDRRLLSRLLVATADDDELRRWALGAILAQATAGERRHARDSLLRAAASLMPAPTPWTRARRLRALAVELARALPVELAPYDLRGTLAAALLLDPGRVPSVKTLARIIVDTHT